MPARADAVLQGWLQPRTGLPGRPRGLEVHLQWSLYSRSGGAAVGVSGDMRNGPTDEGDGTTCVIVASQNKSYSLFMYVGDVLGAEAG